MAVNRPVLITLALLIIAVILVFGLRAYHLDTYTIPSTSMEPTLKVGDRVEIDPTFYAQNNPQSGDVVVFDGTGSLYPYESETKLKRFRDNVLDVVGMAPKDNAVVKRVIATEGDTLECCDAGDRLILNGDTLEEPYLAAPARPASSNSFRVEVPEGRVFLLGDNRYDSIDSRALLGAPGGGMIQISKIYGPVISTR